MLDNDMVDFAINNDRTSYNDRATLLAHLKLEEHKDCKYPALVKARQQMLDQTLADISVDALLHGCAVSKLEIRSTRINGQRCSEKICLTTKGRPLLHGEAKAHIDIVKNMAAQELAAGSSRKDAPTEAYYCSILMHCVYHDDDNISELALAALCKLGETEKFTDALGIEAVVAMGTYDEFMADNHPPVITGIVRNTLARPDLLRLIESGETGKNCVKYCQRIIEELKQPSIRTSVTHGDFSETNTTSPSEQLRREKRRVSHIESESVEHRESVNHGLMPVLNFDVEYLQEYKGLVFNKQTECDYLGAYKVNSKDLDFLEKLQEILNKNQGSIASKDIKIFDIDDSETKKMFHVLMTERRGVKEVVIIDACPMTDFGQMGDVLPHPVGQTIAELFHKMNYVECNIVNYASNEYVQEHTGGGWATSVNYCEFKKSNKQIIDISSVKSLVKHNIKHQLVPNLPRKFGYAGLSLFKYMSECKKETEVNLMSITGNFIVDWNKLEIVNRSLFLKQLCDKEFNGQNLAEEEDDSSEYGQGVKSDFV